jgi:hypothetical protein
MWGFLDRLGIALSRWGNGKEREFGDEADSNYYMQFPISTIFFLSFSVSFNRKEKEEWGKETGEENGIERETKK